MNARIPECRPLASMLRWCRCLPTVKRGPLAKNKGLLRMCHVLCVGVYYPVQDFVHGVHGTWARPVSAALSSTVHSDTVGMVLPF